MRSNNAMDRKSPPAHVVMLATLLAILSLSAAATATARAQEAQEDQAYGSRVESEYYTDEADTGFSDFSDDEFGDSTALGDEDFGDVGFGTYDEFAGDEGFVDVEEDMFNFDAEYGHDYDEQLVADETSDQAAHEYQQDVNAFETNEAWFEDWFDDEE